MVSEYDIFEFDSDKNFPPMLFSSVASEAVYSHDLNLEIHSFLSSMAPRFISLNLTLIWCYFVLISFKVRI